MGEKREKKRIGKKEKETKEKRKGKVKGGR